MDLTSLWVAANVHSATIIGEFLCDNEINNVTGVPVMPDDPDEVIRLVTEYLRGAV
jgi:hypothetical protein